MKILTVLILLLISVLCLTCCGNDSADIAVIGGADGPTTVFITSNINWFNICGMFAIIVIAIFIAMVIYRKKKNK